MIGEDIANDEILDAAERLFERYGYGKTTVEEIAKEAGIGKGSIYLHFESKEDLAFAWVDRIHKRIFARLESVLAEDQGYAARLTQVLIDRVLSRYDCFAKQARSMDEAFLALKFKLLGRRDAFHEREANLIADHIQRGTANRAFREVEPLRTARSMVTATNALLPYSIRPDQLGDRADVAEKASDLAGLLTLAVTLENL